jgi:hypothetical protein
MMAPDGGTERRNLYLPWRVDVEDLAGVTLIDIRDCRNQCVAETGDLVLAHFIVDACNAHGHRETPKPKNSERPA